MDMPLYGGRRSASLTAAVLLRASSKGRISIAAYKCLALMKNSPQRSREHGAITYSYYLPMPQDITGALQV